MKNKISMAPQTNTCRGRVAVAHSLPRGSLPGRSRHPDDRRPGREAKFLYGYTLKGKEEAIAPLRFDKGANTILKVSNVIVNGDTIDCDLLERNDVLTACGINELHHFPRFILKDGSIKKILSRKTPVENKAFVDCITAFAGWLSVNSPEEYKKFWPEGKFNYSEERGKAMPIEIRKWRERNH